MPLFKSYVYAIIAALLLNIIVVLVIFYPNHHHQIKQIAIKLLHTVPTIPSPVSVASVVKQSFSGMVKTDRSFAGPGGLKGLVLSLKSNPKVSFIAYYDDSRQTLLLGQVFNKQGLNTTLQATVKYLKDPEKQALYDKIQTWPTVQTGAFHPKHIVTIIADPNSPVFVEQYQALLLAERDNSLAVHWILVNYLKPMGPNLAAWVLSGSNPRARLQQVSMHRATYWAQQKLNKPSFQTVLQLRRNWNLMQSNHLVPGPVTIFKAQKAIYVLHGLLDPESFDYVINHIRA